MEKGKKRFNLPEFFLGIIAVISCIGTYLAIPGIDALLTNTPPPTPEILNLSEVPLFTELPNTPDNSVLEIGTPWTNSNRQLILLHVNRNEGVELPCRYSFEFTIRNYTETELIVPINPKDFSLVTDRGEVWQSREVSIGHSCPESNIATSFIGRVPLGGMWVYENANSWVVWFDEAAFRSGDSNLILKVDNELPVSAFWSVRITDVEQ